jgi:NTP pyrophosphatase (non-canonical NTP hydrolase)
MNTPDNPYRAPHPLPTAHERELLTIIQEECAEIIVQIAKGLRFGMNNGYPGKGVTNREALGHEIGDLEAILATAESLGLFRARDVAQGKAEKYDRLKQFMQTRADD